MRGFDDFELKLGDIMRGERATLGKSLLDVQRELKIKATYIAAIEDTDLSAFETPGFVAGYVRSYARYLGMEPDETWATFCRESGFAAAAPRGPATPPSSPAARTRPAHRGRGPSDEVLSRNPLLLAPQGSRLAAIEPGAVGSLLVLVGLIAALGYGAFAVLQEIQRVTVAPVETELAALPGAAPEGEGLLTENPAPTVEALDRLYRPRALDRPVLVARDGPIATLDPRDHGLYAAYDVPRPLAGLDGATEGAVATGIAEATELALADGPDPAPAPVAPELAAVADGEVQVSQPAPPRVAVFARRPAWVRIRAADGSILLEKILDGGESFVLPETEQPAVLRAGNSGALYFAVGGRTLGPAGAPGSVVKNVVLSADALSDGYAEAELTGDPDLARMAELFAEAAGETAAEAPIPRP